VHIFQPDYARSPHESASSSSSCGSALNAARSSSTSQILRPSSDVGHSYAPASSADGRPSRPAPAARQRRPQAQHRVGPPRRQHRRSPRNSGGTDPCPGPFFLRCFTHLAPQRCQRSSRLGPLSAINCFGTSRSARPVLTSRIASRAPRDSAFPRQCRAAALLPIRSNRQ
jgi:hypothetical protein